MLKSRPDIAILPAPRIISAGIAAALSLTGSVICSAPAGAQDAVRNAGAPNKKQNAAQQKRAYEFCNQGNNAKSRGNDKEALQCYRQAVALDPGNGTYHKYLAEVLVPFHQPEQALHEIDLAIKLRPDDAKMRVVRGTVLENLNRTDEAVKEYRTALAMGKCGQGVFSYLHKIYMRHNDYRAALELASMRVKEYPTEAVSYYDKARLEIAVKDYKAALATAALAAKIAPYDYKPWELSGDAHLNSQDFQQAVKDYSKCLELEPFFTAVIYKKRAQAYTALGHRDLAQKDIEKSRE